MSAFEFSLRGVAVWDGRGVALGPWTPHAPGPLGPWHEAPALNDVHPRARRPHPLAARLVQLASPLLGPLPAGARETTGVLLGTRAGCLVADLDFQQGLTQRDMPMGSPSTFVYTLPTAFSGEISVAYGLRGPALVLNSGTCPLPDVLVLAARWLSTRRAERVLCGAVEFRPGDEAAALLLLEHAHPGCDRLTLTQDASPGASFDTDADNDDALLQALSLPAPFQRRLLRTGASGVVLERSAKGGLEPRGDKGT